MERVDRDELISAYLDGELTAEEQSAVERQLARSAELRQLLDDMRALRASLELLPRERLEPEFAQDVLRRAEQAMLGVPLPLAETVAPRPAVARAVALPQVALPPAETVDSPRGWRSRRRWIWAGAAVAAALVVVFFSPPANRPVADAPDQPADPGGTANLAQAGAEPGLEHAREPGSLHAPDEPAKADPRSVASRTPNTIGESGDPAPDESSSTDPSAKSTAPAVAITTDRPTRTIDPAAVPEPATSAVREPAPTESPAASIPSVASQPTALLPAGALAVHIDLTPEAVRSDLFKKVLAECKVELLARRPSTQTRSEPAPEAASADGKSRATAEAVVLVASRRQVSNVISKLQAQVRLCSVNRVAAAPAALTQAESPPAELPKADGSPPADEPAKATLSPVEAPSVVSSQSGSPSASSSQNPHVGEPTGGQAWPVELADSQRRLLIPVSGATPVERPNAASAGGSSEVIHALFVFRVVDRASASPRSKP